MKDKLYRIIFLSDTKGGQLFDLILIIMVMLSVLSVALESVEEIKASHLKLFQTLEWFFTLSFSLEFVLRLYCAPSKRAYLLSFYGIVDLASILPQLLTIFFPQLNTLSVIRSFRVLRIFRILKLQRFLNAGHTLGNVLWQSREKIIVFLGFTITTVFIMGALLYLVEGPQNGFTSIPKSMYWAIVTLTTVGYGDIVPQTVIGKMISSAIMIIGYGIIALPTGLVSAEVVREAIKNNNDSSAQHPDQENQQAQCDQCHSKVQRDDKFCRHCGHALFIN